MGRARFAHFEVEINELMRRPIPISNCAGIAHICERASIALLHIPGVDVTLRISGCKPIRLELLPGACRVPGTVKGAAVWIRRRMADYWNR